MQAEKSAGKRILERKRMKMEKEISLSKLQSELEKYSVTIIVAAYNCEKTIRHCIQSLLNQTYKAIEIVIINDGSTDNTAVICKELCCNRVRYFDNSCNLGVSATRNQGIDLANGDLLIFVDSDDWVEKDYVYNLVSLMDKWTAMGICGFFYHNAIEKKAPEKYLYSIEGTVSSLGKKDLYQLSHCWHYSTLWNKIMWTHIIRNGDLHFEEKLSIGEDTRFILQYINLFDEAKIKVLSKPMYHYVQSNKNSLWFTQTTQWREALKNAELLYNIVRESNGSKAEEYYLAECSQILQRQFYINHGRKTSETKAVWDATEMIYESFGRKLAPFSLMCKNARILWWKEYIYGKMQFLRKLKK